MSTTWHKEMRNKNREEIIKAAQKLLLEKDFSEVKMKDICEIAGVSRVTFYKYFSTLDDIAFEVQMKVIDEMVEYINKQTVERGTGLEKLESLLQIWLKFTFENPNHIKYIGFFDHYYNNNFPNEDLAERYREFVMEGRRGRNILMDMYLKEGMEDGSIRPDIDPDKVGFTIFETTISLLQRLVTRGEVLKKEHDLDFSEIMNTVFAMVLQYVKKEK
ncbi:TetR/AcrR family transcriptional regulator [Alkalihalobacillus sp. MEB130]|uniref:TetR/AcrR family transcriptional regulator n=1 Tax=Alkalihalobacillus sp. MEB130 TaxID=2976704 RepID=UPI0028DD9BD2|nr:TetR/AcrR family transcriptional regulator [Alkalihalobacillus sp. MEB130]MDT8860211.1 TetR/AcrR family transcriptional regulator [Alkalihalobacillus sp. MEB130]